MLASLTKEQLVKRFLELESRVAVLEMQMEAVKRAEEEIAEIGEEEYDFSKGEFPMSRYLFFPLKCDFGIIFSPQGYR